MMDRDNITRTGARAPGVKRQWPLERRCASAPRSSASNEDKAQGSEVHEGRMQTARREELAVYGKAPSDKPALKPYWGKPAVRNFREDGGNVGIIRSPVRATALPGEVLRGQDTRGQRPARPGAGSEGRGPHTRTPWPGIPVGFRSVEPGDHG